MIGSKYLRHSALCAAGRGLSGLHSVMEAAWRARMKIFRLKRKLAGAEVGGRNVLARWRGECTADPRRRRSERGRVGGWTIRSCHRHHPPDRTESVRQKAQAHVGGKVQALSRSDGAIEASPVATWPVVGVALAFRKTAAALEMLTFEAGSDRVATRKAPRRVINWMSSTANARPSITEQRVPFRQRIVGFQGL